MAGLGVTAARHYQPAGEGAATVSARVRKFSPRRDLEATPRIELGMEVLQTSALPLGYVAARLRF